MVKRVENDVNGRFLLCQGGLTSQSLRDALVRTFIDFERKDVLVMIGTNDLLQDVPCPVILSNIDAVLQELRRKKVGEIYLCNVAAIPKVLENCTDELLVLNEKLMERNSLENSVNVIDCSAVFMVDGGFNETYFEKCHGVGVFDDIHPNADGLIALYEFIKSNVV